MSTVIDYRNYLNQYKKDIPDTIWIIDKILETNKF